MSHAALCRAVAEVLRDRLSTPALGQLGELTLDVQLDAMPNPISGEFYLAVFPSSWRSTDVEGLLEEYSIGVGISRRLGKSPTTVWGSKMWADAQTGVEAVCRAILSTLHLDKNADAVRNRANEIIAETAPNSGGFATGIRFRDGGRPERKGADWWNGVEPPGGKWAAAGVAQQLTFGGAVRVQSIEDMA